MILDCWSKAILATMEMELGQNGTFFGQVNYKARSRFWFLHDASSPFIINSNRR